MVTLRPLDPAFPVRVEGGGTKFYTMKKHDIEKDRIYNMCQASILMLEELWETIKEAKMQNEQFVLNFLDKLNEISVRN